MSQDLNYVSQATHTGKIQLLSIATPNGIKVACMLEELNVPYDPITINIAKNEQFSPAFLDVQPNNKIPAIVDPRVPVNIRYPTGGNGNNSVQIALGYYRWQPIEMVKDSQSWMATVYLPPGEHQFKFVVDGTWRTCEELNTTYDASGIQNNVIRVIGEPLKIWESGAILLHLAEVSGKFLPKDWYGRVETLKWLFWQVGGVGPNFGQYGHFAKYAKEKLPYAVTRFETEVKRALGVLNKQLEGKQYIIGDEYTIADIATWPWVNALEQFYHNHEILKEFSQVVEWLTRCKDRPASQRGMAVTPFPV